jgi:hypothetical protein
MPTDPFDFSSAVYTQPQQSDVGGMFAPPTAGVAQNASPSSNMLFNALRGVQAPPVPQAQKVATPDAPKLQQMHPDAVISMLSALGVTPKDVYALPRLNLGR